MRHILSCPPYVHIDLFYQYLGEYNRSIVFISALSIRVTCPVNITYPILTTRPKQCKLWRWSLNKHANFSYSVSQVPVIEPRALITGEGGTPPTGRRSVRRLDTAIRSTGLQQRWLSWTMMFT